MSKKKDQKLKEEELTEDINNSDETLTVEEPASVVEMSEEEKIQQELAETKDKFIRLYSEFENYRRRTAKETIEIRINAAENLIKELLPVLDDFERAQKSIESATELAPIKEGITLIFDKLSKTLAAKGLKAMDSKDKIFDAEVHECVTQFDAGEDKKGLVIDEVEKGYFLNEKVVRYAKVVVGS